MKLKKCVANASILGIIIGKLHYEKKPSSIILLKVVKSLEVGYHYAILPFVLTVHLWMRRGGESSLDAKEIERDDLNFKVNSNPWSVTIKFGRP